MAFFIMPFSTYVLESETSGMFYIGSTSNLEDRLIRHNTGRNTFTKNKGPWRLVGFKSFDTRAEAVQLERLLKGFKSKAKVRTWLTSSS
jgi:putative endonuclease